MGARGSIESGDSNTSVTPVIANGGVRRGSIIEGLREPFTKFLIAIKLFEIDTLVCEAAKQLGLAYNTVYNIHSLIRSAILATNANASSFSGEIEMDESYFGGRRKGKHG